MSSPRAGRRIAVSPPHRLDHGVLVAVVLVLVAALSVVLTGSGRAPGTERRAATAVPPDHAVAGCPALAPERGTTSVVAAGSAPVSGAAEPAGAGTGEGIRVADPAGSADPVDEPITRRGQVARSETGSNGPDALAVTAAGALAAGLFAFQSDITEGGATAVSPCPAPRTRWWFTGAGATLDHTSELVLANVDPGPAVVDVTVLGPDGEVETLGTRGITVPAGGRTVMSMTDVAPQADELAIGVVASRGRVVAATRDELAPEPGAATGVDWLPAAGATSRLLRIPGLPAKSDSQTLLVANPSDLEALVELKVSGSSGTFAPSDGAQVRVPPGAVVATEITDAVGRDAAALTLRSRVPVTASVRSVAADDTSYAGPTVPLHGPAAAPLPDRQDASVQLTAGRARGAATVTTYDEDGSEVETESVEVAAGTTATWRPDRKAAYLTVVPATGRLVGAVSYTGAGLAQLGLDPLVLRVDRPLVRPALH